MLLCIILSLFTIFSFTMSLGTLQGSPASKAMNNISKEGCQTHCGDVVVPYPFGIAVGNDTSCALDDSFYVTCNESHTPPKLFIRSGNIDIYNISDSELRIYTIVASRCYTQNGDVYDDFYSWMNIKSLFNFSVRNKLTVIGCDDYALITGEGEDYFSSGCFGLCREINDVVNGECSGRGCCQTSIPKGVGYYKVTLKTFENHTDVWSFNQCGYAFLGEEGSFVFRVGDVSNVSDAVERIESTIPVVLDWVVAPGKNCSQSHKCKQNSSCHDVEGGGYRCRCNDGYEGNPYLGCQDINECEDNVTYPCHGDCVDTEGSYNCTCPTGSFGDAKTVNGCIKDPKGFYAEDPKVFYAEDPKFSSSIICIIAIVLGLLAILCVTAGIFFGIRRRKLTRLREKFFEQNGGVLLKQKISSQGSHNVLTLFSIKQLRRATDNYSQEHVIGRGAYGVVYKGVLPDKRLVAIKKSIIVDASQAEQFINEVMILTQVIHRNVVKLLGCCLEQEVPVLVYEFVSNNTLFHHIHHRLGGMSWLSWENRLRVALEAASALAYLHSETSMPIIHRDVKSTNILLDENYTAKISDFGASRLVPLDHKHVSTLIQGTLGYLDPEYFNTSQLTEKSDVYSFGVVLAELITGKKPIGVDRTNAEKNLAAYFVNSITKNRLFQIIEPRVIHEGTLEQLQELGDLIKRCLDSKGCNRPTMKEVAVTLDDLRKFTAHPWIEQKRCEKTRSLVLEVEQSDLYEVPLVSYGSTWE